MVKLLTYIVLLFATNYAYSQISIFYDATTNKFTEKNDYQQEGSDLWVGIGVNGIVLNEINLIDTIKLFSSFGCAQYQLSDTTLTIYLWLDYYYGSDCLCTEYDNFCTPDTGNCDLKIRFFATQKGLSCYFSKIRFKYINLEKIATLSCYICSENYLKLTKKNYDIENSKFKNSIDFSYSNLDYYLELSTYLIEIRNIKCYKKFHGNIKFVLECEKTKKNDEYLYYEQYSNYSDLIIKYLFPLQDKLYSGNKLNRIMKRIILLSSR